MRFKSLNTALIVGLGLIGGSLAKALRDNRFCKEVVGFDVNRDELDAGLTLGVIDRAADELGAAVAEADLIVLAVPVKVMEKVLAEIKPYLKPDAVITDVGSTKASFVQAARQVFDPLPPGFIPGHPIAGSEKSGVAAADGQLFERHKVIVTPLPETDPKVTLLISRLWQACGAEVLQMDPYRHDEVLAATSHLPHILAFSLVDTLAQEEDSTEIFRYAAGGFRDFTRVAASDPAMWHDICLANRTAMLKQLDRFVGGVQRLRTAIDQGDGQSMLGIFTRARAAREHFSRILADAAYVHSDNDKQLTLHLRSSAEISGELHLPGDRSICHRAIMLGCLAEGVTEISGFIASEDTLATLQAFRDMGVVIEGPHLGHVKIYGVGLHGLQPPPGPLYLGNSETSMRLLAGVLAGQAFNTELYGSESLNAKPMDSIIAPLTAMGAQISADNGCAPLKISGGRALSAPPHALAVPGAQVKSAVLLAGLYSTNGVRLEEVSHNRDHTERMLQGLGAKLNKTGTQIELQSSVLSGRAVQVPGDLGFACFFIVMAALAEKSELTLRGVGINPSRTQILEILQMMGVELRVHPHAPAQEPVADIQLIGAQLQGVNLGAAQWQSARDSLLLIIVAAMAAEGETCLHEMPEAVHAGLAPVLKQLTALGADIEYRQQTLTVRRAVLRSGVLDAADSYRAVLAFIAASQLSDHEMTIKNSACLNVSFPGFAELAQRAGIRIQMEED